MRAIAITAKRKAELIELPNPSDPLEADEVEGHTLISLVSPGTEVHANFLGERFPNYPGYASVFRIDGVGSEIKDLKSGDLVFGMGEHRSFQRAQRKRVIAVPPGVAEDVAVFARLMGVSMTTLNTTTARPPERVLVTGLGPVGNLAAQIFSLCGYQVTAVDPVEGRRTAALETGIPDVRSAVDGSPNDLKGQVALHLECSGHEQAALDGCKVVRRRGEVVLVGLAWQRRTEIYAAELLSTLFHRYAVLRSGWEWEIPVLQDPTTPHSIYGNFAAALKWLAEDRIKVDHLATRFRPDQAQEVYDGLYTQSLSKPTVLFDWRDS